MSAEELDIHLEPLTGLLIRLTDDADPAELVRVQAGPVAAVLEGSSTNLTIGVPGNERLPAGRRLSDYQSMLLFAMGFEAEDDPDGSEDLYLDLEIDEADEWEEQSLREIALQTLGILYYVYECREAQGYTLEWG